jgi:hypothetical protein
MEQGRTSSKPKKKDDDEDEYSEDEDDEEEDETSVPGLKNQQPSLAEQAARAGIEARRAFEEA